MHRSLNRSLLSYLCGGRSEESGWFHSSSDEFKWKRAVWWSQVCRLTFGSEDVAFHPDIIKNSIQITAKRMSSADPLPHHRSKNSLRAPTLWLSIFHFCTLRLSFLFVRSYYYYQGNFCRQPLTQRVPLPHHHDAGFHTTFLTGGGRQRAPLEEWG